MKTKSLIFWVVVVTILAIVVAWTARACPPAPSPPPPPPPSAEEPVGPSGPSEGHYNTYWATQAVVTFSVEDECDTWIEHQYGTPWFVEWFNLTEWWNEQKACNGVWR